MLKLTTQFAVILLYTVNACVSVIPEIWSVTNNNLLYIFSASDISF